MTPLLEQLAVTLCQMPKLKKTEPILCKASFIWITLSLKVMEAWLLPVATVNKPFDVKIFG